jgi:hypothetical protein
MNTLHIWPEEPKLERSQLTRSARLELGGAAPVTLWYRFSEEHASFLTDSCDPFLVGSILMAMRNRARIHVHGRVSRSLIVNLFEFQSAWQCWRPEKYVRVRIGADEEGESEPPPGREAALCAFTGGVDSTFTIYRHKSGLCGRGGRKIEAALFVQGFDIPLEDHDAFARAADRASRTLRTLDVPLITMASNHKELNHEWNDTHGIGLASCLMFFQRRFAEGLIPSTYTYADLSLPWGSNPITDHLLSSKSFRVSHDGAARSRLQKLVQLKDWPEGYNNLRVCYSCEQKDQNCSRCSKCILTLLTFKLFGLPLPQSFREDVTEQAILALRDLPEHEVETIESFLRSCQGSAGATRWTRALERSIAFNSITARLVEPRNNEIAERFRRVALRVHHLIGP